MSLRRIENSDIKKFLKQVEVEGGQEVTWLNVIANVLDNEKLSIPNNYNADEIYLALIDFHKEIYGKKHDMYWSSGFSRSQLHSQLLIRIFCMLKNLNKK